MRNLKKLMAIVLTVAMLASFAVVPAFADTMDDAQIVTTLGMIEGTGKGVTTEYLASTPQRYQAAKMFLVLKGLYEDALEYEGDANFDDAEELQWVEGRNMLAYLWANKDLGFVGYTDGTFRPYVPMTAQQYYKLMLTALGYEQDVDFAYNDTLEFAAELGLGAVAEADPFTIDDLATATVEALKATPKDADETLIAQLVAAGAVDADVAESTGIYKAAVTELAVEDIEVDNLIQINVIFNEASLLDKEAAEKTDNYDLVDSDDEEIEIADASVSGSVVTLTLEEEVDQQTEAILTINDKVLDKKADFEVEFLDTTIPTVVGAEVVGNDTIKVIFSEPVTDTAEDTDFYEVDGGDYYIYKVELVNNNTEANVELYADLEEGDLDIKVLSGVEDYAGFGVIPVTKTVTVVEDNDAPVVVGYKDAKPRSVTLIFNEDVEIYDKDPDNFYHTNTSNTILDKLTDGELVGKELTLEFDEDNQLPNGTAYLYIKADAVNDLWDNRNNSIQVKVEVEVDNEAPVLDEWETDGEDKLVLKFNEEIDDDFDEDNFTLLDENGKELKGDVKKAELKSDDDKKIIVTFDGKLSGDYTLVIEDIEDVYGNVMPDTALDFNVGDETDPKFEDFKATLYSRSSSKDNKKLEQMIKINFGEKMATEGKYSVTDLEKYVVIEDGNSQRLDKIDDVKVKVVDNGQVIEIEIPLDEDDDFYFDEDGDQILVMARVADAAGNYTAQLTSPSTEEDGIIIAKSGTVDIDKVEATDVDTIVVTFKDYFKSFDAKDIEIYVDAEKVTPSKVRTSLNSDGNTVATYTLPSDLDTDAAGATISVVAEPKSENKYGESIASYTDKIVEDKIAPELAEIDDEDADDVRGYVYDHEEVKGLFNTIEDFKEYFADADDSYVVVLTFTEHIKASSVSTVSFEVEDCTVERVLVIGNKIILDLDDKDELKEDFDVVQKALIRDLSDNSVDDIDTEVFEVNENPED